MSQSDGDAGSIAQFIGGEGWSRKQAARWLEATGGLGQCDSVSIDPHKPGYIPYPAGAVIYRDYRVREFIRCHAPYLNAAPIEAELGAGNQWHTPAAGQYTLEGSRPGACGAANWLAHRTVTLDHSGPGLLIAQSIAGAYWLQQVMEREFSRDGSDGSEK